MIKISLFPQIKITMLNWVHNDFNQDYLTLEIILPNYSVSYFSALSKALKQDLGRCFEWTKKKADKS
jgi:hypothetical protein